MGNCTFTIHTVGCHGNVRDNGKHLAEDAEVLIEKMVEMLRAAGHSVASAKLTYGGEYVVGVSPKAEPEAPPTPQSAPTPPAIPPGPVDVPAPVPPAVIVPEPPAAPSAPSTEVPATPAVDPNTPAAG